MSYAIEYLEAVLENKDSDAINEGWFQTIMTEEFTSSSYAEGADFLEGKLDFDDVEFNSFVLTETFESDGWGNGRWTAGKMLFRIFDIDDYNESNVYSKAETLLKYNEEFDLPDDWGEKLEKANLLDNFKQNYSKINVSEDYSNLSTDKVIEIIQNKDYDVYDTDQVEKLASLIYYMTNDKSPSFAQEGVYDSTRQWNQLAINADMDTDILNAIEAGGSGWYADDDSIDSQFSKVEMQDFTRDAKRAHAIHMRDHKVTEEMVDAWNIEYDGILSFIYNKGFVGLEDQRNDTLVVEFNGEEIYRDEGRGNDFGNTSLDSTPIKDLLSKNDYKTTAEVFMF